MVESILAWQALYEK